MPPASDSGIVPGLDAGNDATSVDHDAAWSHDAAAADAMDAATAPDVGGFADAAEATAPADAADASDAADADAGLPSGTPDPTFGTGGIATIPCAYCSIAVHGVVAQSNGAIVYGGNVWSEPDQAYILLVGRLTSAGMPDTTFATTGQVTAEQPGYYDEVGNAVALVPGGGIMVVGFTDTTSNHMMFATRLTDKGLADPTFGGGTGFVALADNDVDSKAAALVVQPDMQTVLGGFMGPSTAVARLTASGSADPSFDPPTDAGPVGLDTFTIAGGGMVNQLVRLGSGRILAALQSSSFMVVAITPQGTIDASYGNAGIASVALPTALSAGAVDIVALPDGSIVCAGSTPSSIELARFDATGQLDPKFGNAGRASVPSALAVQGLARLPDGSLAVSLEEPSSSIGVAKLTADGNLDTGFGQQGFSTLAASATSSVGMAVDGQGRIDLVVGTNQNAVSFARILP